MNIRLPARLRAILYTGLASSLSLPTRASAATLQLPLAEIPAQLKSALQVSLGLIFLFGFIWGVIKIWNGADRLSKGDSDGKMGLFAGVIIAGAGVIMGALFSIFGMGDGILSPQF